MRYQLLFLSIAAAILFNSYSDNNPVITGSYPSPLASTFDGSFAAQWMDVAYNTAVAQSPNPPMASRIYAYVAIAMYESVRNGIPFGLSLSGQLNGMPSMPSISASAIYDWPSCLTGATSVVLRGIIDTVLGITDQRITNLRNQQISLREQSVSTDIVNRSVAYGEAIGNKILEWSRTDHYLETRTMVYIVPPRSQNPAFWAPTDLEHPHPTEPYWGTLRPFVLPNSHYCDVAMTTFFDSTSNSAFYNMANEVKTTVDNLTQEQAAIALYWQDKLGTGTPPGHWVSIMNQVVGFKNLRLDAAAGMYALTCIAMGDAFIECWQTKYTNNLLRAKTFIQAYIPGGQNWEPFLLTPPFPAYTCGHCCESEAAAEVLMNLFGQVSFTDTTLQSLGFQNRSFTSFRQAADEAMMSRLYGGIHYRQDNEHGRTMGINVGDIVISRIRLKLNP